MSRRSKYARSRKPQLDTSILVDPFVEFLVEDRYDRHFNDPRYRHQPPRNSGDGGLRVISSDLFMSKHTNIDFPNAVAEASMRRTLAGNHVSTFDILRQGS